jgi:hypothetical protein
MARSASRSSIVVARSAALTGASGSSSLRSTSQSRSAEGSVSTSTPSSTSNVFTRSRIG